MTATTTMPPARRPANPQLQWWMSWFEHSAQGLVVCEPRGQVIAANPQAMRFLTGTEPGQAGMVDLRTAFSNVTSDKIFQWLLRPRQRRETISYVPILIDGQLSMMVDLSLIPLGDGCGLVVVEDVGQRCRMESHLHRLATAIDTAPDVFFLTDAEFKLIYVNSAFQAATGHSIEEALGHTTDFLRVPGQDDKISSYLDRVRQGLDWTGELLNRRKDGTIYPVSCAIGPVNNRRGQCVGLAACERDISSAHKLQEDLQLERNYAQSIVNSLEAAVYTVDRQLRLTHFNEAWRALPRVHGWLSLEQPPKIGQPLLDLVKDPAQRGQLEHVFADVLATRNPQELHDSSQGRYWSIKVAPWLHVNEVIGLIYQVADQTHYHELQRQLFQSQKLETVGTLAAGVAHDFNNLLCVIRGNTELMLDEQGANGQWKPMLERIAQAAARAAGLTQQLLSFSRASEDNSRIFNFNEAIQEAGQLSQRSMKGNIELTIVPWATPVMVNMDSTRAQQLLINLCVNAFDAMPQGGKLTLQNQVVALNADQATKAGCTLPVNFLCCSVTDTGMGIPPEVLPRIFDPFYTTKQPGKGTGLGLSIAQSVVQQTGGFMDVTTREGQGTTFLVYLPIVSQRVKREEVRKPAAPRPCGGRVLVVEDQELVRNMVQSFLKGSGFEVELAENGSSALKILTDHHNFDVLFTDFNMPGINGLDLIREVNRRFPGMQCVLTSGCLEPSIEKQVKDECGGRVLTKPYNTREAISLISRMVALRKAPAG